MGGIEGRREGGMEGGGVERGRGEGRIKKWKISANH